MRKPFVAVTPSTDTPGRYHVSMPYMDVLERAGAVPVMLGMNPEDEDIAEIAGRFDGFLFAGGCDVAPYEYGEETHSGCGVIQPKRDRLEINLFREIRKLNKPCFAICRGIQLINVAMGGTLYQDIPSEYTPANGSPALQHYQQTPAYTPTQHVSVYRDSLIHRITGKETLLVNSHHHQAVKTPGRGFGVTAVSADGIVEAIERDDMDFCLAVQWHPEQLAPDMPEQMKLFEAFAEACRK